MFWTGVSLALGAACTHTVIDGLRKKGASSVPTNGLVGLVAILDAVISCSAVFFTGGFQDLQFDAPYLFTLAVLGSSALLLYSKLLYQRALALSPLSLTIPYLSFTPTFLLLTAYLMVGETPSASGLVGVSIITTGGWLLSKQSAPASAAGVLPTSSGSSTGTGTGTGGMAIGSPAAGAAAGLAPPADPAAAAAAAAAAAGATSLSVMVHHHETWSACKGDDGACTSPPSLPPHGDYPTCGRTGAHQRTSSACALSWDGADSATGEALAAGAPPGGGAVAVGGAAAADAGVAVHVSGVAVKTAAQLSGASAAGQYFAFIEGAQHGSGGAGTAGTAGGLGSGSGEQGQSIRKKRGALPTLHSRSNSSGVAGPAAGAGSGGAAGAAGTAAGTLMAPPGGTGGGVAMKPAPGASWLLLRLPLGLARIPAVRSALSVLRPLQQEPGSLMMLCVAAMWSITASLDKLGVLHAPNVWVYLALQRAVIGAAAAAYLTARERDIFAHLRTSLPLLLALSLLELSAVVLFLESIKHIFVSFTVAIKRCNVLFSVLLGGCMFGESIAHRIPHVTLMLLGMTLIALQPGGRSPGDHRL